MKFKSIFLNSVLVVIGFLMLIMPKTCLKAVIVVMGIAGVIGGFYTLINTIRSSIEKSLIIGASPSWVGITMVIFVDFPVIILVIESLKNSKKIRRKLKI